MATNGFLDNHGAFSAQRAPQKLLMPVAPKEFAGAPAQDHASWHRPRAVVETAPKAK